MVLSCEEAANTDFNGWKMMLGGSALTQGLASEAIEQGIEVYTAYGMSETCPLLTVSYLRGEDRALPMAEQLVERTKTGTPVPMVDLDIVDPNGLPVPHDGESMGEVVVRSPWLTQGYFKEPEKGAELWQNGWLHTGDVASIDSRGVVEIKDRIKDVIKTGGEWISSLDLENLISQHSAVAAVAVVGVPDEQWGERPMALVVPVTGAALDQPAVEQHLQQFIDNGQINKWAIPKQIQIVGDIPKTSVGKINKKLIREMQSR
jgi:fatty-acyl-CoA synthase